MRQPQPVSVAQLCQAAGVSRAAYYRHWEEHAPLELDTAVVNRIQELALAHRYYGYRRIHQLLRREGWHVNHKRVLRLMREDNLLSLRRKSWVAYPRPSPDQSWHPNLARGRELTGLNQLWIADITYVRLREQFVYAALLLDAYSRRVIGWAVERHLQTALPLAALRHALGARGAPAGLLHHSDRGVQYACQEYVSELSAHGIGISMSRPGNPYDNARAESFIKTLKAEALDARPFRHLEEARSSLGAFIEGHYNRNRLHSSLGYQAPEEFEQSLRLGPAPPRAAEFYQA